MLEITRLEEMAIQLEALYGDEFDEILSDTELMQEAMLKAKHHFNGISEDDIRKVGQQVLKLYEPID